MQIQLRSRGASSWRSTLIAGQKLGEPRRSRLPGARFIMRMRCQIIRYTWRRRFQGKILIHPKIKRLCLPTWKKAGGGREREKKEKKKQPSRCHIASSLMMALFYLFIHILMLLDEAGLLFFYNFFFLVRADALAAKVSHLFLITAQPRECWPPGKKCHLIPTPRQCRHMMGMRITSTLQTPPHLRHSHMSGTVWTAQVCITPASLS